MVEMIWNSLLPGSHVAESDDNRHSFSAAFCPSEGYRWVLYHTVLKTGASEKTGLFDSLEEAQRTAEIVWRYS